MERINALILWYEIQSEAGIGLPEKVISVSLSSFSGTVDELKTETTVKTRSRVKKIPHQIILLPPTLH